MVDSLNTYCTAQSELGAIHRLCEDRLFFFFTNIEICFTRRQTNGVAHSLAREAQFHASNQLFENIPACIQDLIISDMN